MVQNEISIIFYPLINGNCHIFELCFLFKVNQTAFFAILDKFGQKSRNLGLKMKMPHFQVKTFHYRVNILKIQNSSVPLAKSGFQYLTVVKNWFLNFLLQGPDVGDFNSWIFRTLQGSPITPQLSFSWVRTLFLNPLQATVIILLCKPL